MINRNLNFQRSNGLIPAIIQEEKTGQVLMLGYMNKEAFEKTKETDFVYFWSRKRKKLWMKGETSGNTLKVKMIITDCDRDALLIKVKLAGNAVCHKRKKSCFSDSLK